MTEPSPAALLEGLLPRARGRRRLGARHGARDRRGVSLARARRRRRRSGPSSRRTRRRPSARPKRSTGASARASGCLSRASPSPSRTTSTSRAARRRRARRSSRASCRPITRRASRGSWTRAPSSSARRTATRSGWARRTRTRPTAPCGTPGIRRACRAAPREARPRRSPRAPCRSRSGPTRAGPCGSRPLSAGSWGGSRRTGASRATASSRSRRPSTRRARSRGPWTRGRAPSRSWRARTRGTRRRSRRLCRTSAAAPGWRLDGTRIGLLAEAASAEGGLDADVKASFEKAAEIPARRGGRRHDGIRAARAVRRAGLLPHGHGRGLVESRALRRREVRRAEGRRVRSRRSTGRRGRRASAPRSSGGSCSGRSRSRPGITTRTTAAPRRCARFSRGTSRRPSGEVDAILCPTSPEPAFALGAKTDDPLAMYLADVFTVPAEPRGPARGFGAVGLLPGRAPDRDAAHRAGRRGAAPVRSRARPRGRIRRPRAPRSGRGELSGRARARRRGLRRAPLSGRLVSARLRPPRRGVPRLRRPARRRRHHRRGAAARRRDAGRVRPPRLEGRGDRATRARAAGSRLRLAERGALLRGALGRVAARRDPGALPVRRARDGRLAPHRRRGGAPRPTSPSGSRARRGTRPLLAKENVSRRRRRPARRHDPDSRGAAHEPVPRRRARARHRAPESRLRPGRERPLRRLPAAQGGGALLGRRRALHGPPRRRRRERARDDDRRALRHRERPRDPRRLSREDPARVPVRGVPAEGRCRGTSKARAGEGRDGAVRASRRSPAGSRACA